MDLQPRLQGCVSGGPNSFSYGTTKTQPLSGLFFASNSAYRRITLQSQTKDLTPGERNLFMLWCAAFWRTTTEFLRSTISSEGLDQSFLYSANKILSIDVRLLNDSWIPAIFKYDFSDRHFHRVLGCKAAHY